MRISYVDLETQKSAQEVGGWGNSHLMKVAVGVVYDSLENRFFSFLEEEIEGLVERLTSSEMVIGFNILKFDYQVLQPYTSYQLNDLQTFDMLQDIYKRHGFRTGLGNLAKHTLGTDKSADGMQSLQWFKEGKMDSIIEYCKKDVEVTRDLFLFGKKHGHLLYKKKGDEGTTTIPVDWDFVRR